MLAPEILSSVDAICQHADCLSAVPTTVGAAVAKCLPHGCPFAARVTAGRRVVFDEPGTIERRSADSNVGGAVIPCVFNLFSMLRAASPDASRQHNGVPDTAEQRVAWCGQCLDALAPCLKGVARIAFPYRIGCGQGDWEPYRLLLQQFAVQHPAVEVLVVQSSASFISEQHPDRALNVASRRAHRMLEKCRDPMTRQVGRALLAGLDQNIRDTLHVAPTRGADDNGGTPSVASVPERVADAAYVRAFTASVEELTDEQRRLREGLHAGLRVAREAEDLQYQKHLASQLRNGSLSLEAVRAARDVSSLAADDREIDFPNEGF